MKSPYKKTKRNNYLSNKGEIHKIEFYTDEYEDIISSEEEVEIKIIVTWDKEKKKKEIIEKYDFKTFKKFEKVPNRKNKNITNKYWVLLDKNHIHNRIKNTQKRSYSGTEFEIEVCKENKWERISVSPKIVWTGVGKSNFDKIKSINFKVKDFIPVEGSKYEKYDAINERTKEKIEIKKYKQDKIKKWTMLSEPFFKVATNDSESKVMCLFGNGYKEKYNKFLYEYYQYYISGNSECTIPKSKIGKSILNNISESFDSLQCKDAKIKRQDLKFRYKYSKNNWHGFHRIFIEFKVVN